MCLAFDDAAPAHAESIMAPAIIIAIPILFRLTRDCRLVILMSVAILALHILYMNSFAENVPICANNVIPTILNERHIRDIVFLAIRW